MNSKILKYSALLIILVVSTNCGTLTHGKYQALVVSSNPQGAKVIVNDEPSGTTPTTVYLYRPGYGEDRTNQIRLEREGYEAFESVYARCTNLGRTAWRNSWWNLWLFGGEVFTLVDWITGAAGEVIVYPDTYNRGAMRRKSLHIDLERTPQTPSEQ